MRSFQEDGLVSHGAIPTTSPPRHELTPVASQEYSEYTEGCAWYVDIGNWVTTK